MKRIWGVSLIGIVVAVCVAAGAAWWLRPPSGPALSLEDAYRKSASGELVLIDIRRPSEWRATGVPATGHAITMHQDERTFLKAIQAATGGDFNRTVGLICAAGVRSARMQIFLGEHGYKNVLNVAAGMTGGLYGQGWIRAGLPVRKWSVGRMPSPVSRAQPQ